MLGKRKLGIGGERVWTDEKQLYLGEQKRIRETKLQAKAKYRSTGEESCKAVNMEDASIKARESSSEETGDECRKVDWSAIGKHVEDDANMLKCEMSWKDKNVPPTVRQAKGPARAASNPRAPNSHSIT